MRDTDKRRDADKRALDRRGFLRAVSGGSTVAAAAAMALPVLNTSAEAYDPGREQTKARYRESDDVKAFYRTNGYETKKK
jgi:hypothetical protein